MVLIIFVVCIILGFLCYGINIIRNNKYINFVKQNSVALKKLFDINEKYSFHNSINNFDGTHVYDNKIFYDNISCEDYLIYQLQYQKNNIKKEIDFINDNNNKYRIYCSEIAKIKIFGKYIIDNNNLNKELLFSIEKKIFSKNKLIPDLDFNILITLSCSEINGRIYRRKTQTFSAEQIMTLIRKLNNNYRGFYYDKQVWDAICRVERGRVSNRMRFSIYKRDKYRCRICGRGDRFNNLEIDHIKPIAKGGKSIYDNLQTLCRRCNKRKGDKY